MHRSPGPPPPPRRTASPRARVAFGVAAMPRPSSTRSGPASGLVARSWIMCSWWCAKPRAARRARRNSPKLTTMSRSRGPSESASSFRCTRSESALRVRRPFCDLGASSAASGRLGEDRAASLGGAGGTSTQTGRGTALMACAASQASMNVRRRSLRNVNQRSRSVANVISTSLKRRKAPLPSMAWPSLSRSSVPSAMGMNRSIHRYCSRELTGSIRR